MIFIQCYQLFLQVIFHHKILTLYRDIGVSVINICSFNKSEGGMKRSTFGDTYSHTLEQIFSNFGKTFLIHLKSNIQNYFH